jgi:hypothetical protein
MDISVPTQILVIEPVAAVPAVETLLVEELSKFKVRDRLKIRMVDKSASAEPKLTSLFSRLEVGLQSDGHHSNFLKLRQL